MNGGLGVRYVRYGNSEAPHVMQNRASGVSGGSALPHSGQKRSTAGAAGGAAGLGGAGQAEARCQDPAQRWPRLVPQGGGVEGGHIITNHQSSKMRKNMQKMSIFEVYINVKNGRKKIEKRKNCETHPHCTRQCVSGDGQKTHNGDIAARYGV